MDWTVWTPIKTPSILTLDMGRECNKSGILSNADVFGNMDVPKQWRYYSDEGCLRTYCSGTFYHG
jgi:hypothetical protein